MNTANTQMVRVSITLPKKVWDELEQEILSRERSTFITAAIEDKLRKEKMAKAFTELASLPPTFTDVDDSALLIRDIRKEENKHGVKS
jgi:hypothetical protein